MSAGELGKAYVKTMFNANPVVHNIKTEIGAVKAIVNGDGKALGNIIGGQTANTAMVLATEGAGSALSKGVGAIRGTAASGLGDLTTGEVRNIQSVVNKSERPL